MNKSELKKIIKEEIQILQEQTTSNSINNSLLLTAFATWVNSNGGWSANFSNCMSTSVRGWLLNDIFTLPVWNSQNSNQPCQFSTAEKYAHMNASYPQRFNNQSQTYLFKGPPIVGWWESFRFFRIWPPTSKPLMAVCAMRMGYRLTPQSYRITPAWVWTTWGHMIKICF